MPEDSTTPDRGETARRSIEAFGRLDFDATLAPFVPDAVEDMLALGMGTFVGHEGIRGFLEDLDRSV